MSNQASATFGRLRAARKWINSKLVISELLGNKFIGRKTVWSPDHKGRLRDLFLMKFLLWIINKPRKK